jgi:hypothetical protein
MKYNHIVAGILSAFWCASLAPVLADTIPVNNLVQIVASDSATAKTVAWQDSSGRRDYTVTYRQKGSSETARAFVTSPKRPPVYDAEWVPPYTYGAYMQGLRPDTEYEYEIADADGESGWFPFHTTTEQLNRYEVLVFSDTQSTDYSVWGQTAQAAYEAHPGAAFFTVVGDLSDNGQSWYQWKAWYENADILTSYMPIAPVLGNHEAYSLDWKFCEPYTYKASFPVPYGAPEGQSRLAYSFDYGDVHYAALNTDYEELHELYPDMMEHEVTWLDQDLADARKRGKRLVVLMHRPAVTATYRALPDINGTYFMPLFDKYHVPLVFTAHEHCYARTEPLIDGRPGEGGTTYISTGRAGTESYTDTVKRYCDAAYYNPTDQPMYLTLAVEPDTFTVTAYKTDGTVIDTASIAAPPPSGNTVAASAGISKGKKKVRKVVQKPAENRSLQKKHSTEDPGSWQKEKPDRIQK